MENDEMHDVMMKMKMCDVIHGKCMMEHDALKMHCGVMLSL